MLDTMHGDLSDVLCLPLDIKRHVYSGANSVEIGILGPGEKSPAYGRWSPACLEAERYSVCLKEHSRNCIVWWRLGHCMGMRFTRL